MAFPKDINKIHTNLPDQDLKKVLAAIDEGLIAMVPGSIYLHEYIAGCQFYYKGVLYEMSELSEVLETLNRVDNSILN